MKAIALGTLCLLTSATAFSEVVTVRSGSVIDDENIKRSIVLFKDYKDAIMLKNECDTDTTEVPAFVLINKNLIPACWEPARTDGIGSIRYTNQFNEKEFSFDESTIKFKTLKFDTAKNKLLP